jgi:phage tail-like protein
MQLSLRDMLGLNNRFHVTISGIDLGGWGQCKGLEVDFKNDHVDQGGVYDYQKWTPGALNYSPITLRRAVNPADSAKVQQWLSSMVNSWVHSAKVPDGGTAVITLFHSDGTPVMTWSLRSVYPSKWSGPELDASTAGIAMETLQIVHEGFL